MPRRHPAHQTGTAALRAFQSALPKAWTFDTPDGDNDYGIDGSVRLFLPTGEPLQTGFDVQIKGTAELNLRKALKLSFDVETLNGYLDHDRPVLLVRYHEPTRTLYARWRHKQLRRPIKPGQKTATFYWGDEDRWTMDTPDRLLRDTIRHRTAVEAGLILPVTAGVRFETGDGLTDRDVLRLRRAFRDAESPVLSVSLSAPQHMEPLINVLVGPLGFEVDVAGVTGGGVDLPPDFDSATESDALVASALVFIALRLAGLGHSDPAARLMESHLPSSTLQAIPSFTLQAVRLLLATGRASFADRYITALLDGAEQGLAEDGDLGNLGAVDAALLMYALWEPRDRTALDGHVGRRASLVEAHAPADAAADALVGQANHLRNGVQEPDRNLQAFALYNRARRLDPGLCTDPDFLATVAGVLYDLCRYRRSADLYARSVGLGEDGDHILARYGDALLMSGWFLAASQLIERRAASEVHPPSSLWLLKQSVAERLAEAYGDAPERDQSGAAELVPQTIGDTEAHADAARAALALDPLNVSASHNLATYHLHRDEVEPAAWLFTRIAVVQPADARAWRDAFFQFLCLASSGRELDDYLMVLVLDAALTYRERPFLDLVRQTLDENGDDATTQAVEAMIEHVRSIRRLYGSALARNPEPPQGAADVTL